MIDKLRSMAIFANVIDQGSFRAAALHLGLAPSRISQTVSDLEKELGVTLLYRSTRQLSLTSEGQALYDKVVEMLYAAETGLDAINLSSSEPTGELRVTAPAFVTVTELMDSLASFARENPGVRLKLNFSDLQRDLIRDDFDVGIRAGWLKDSELMTRNIGQSDRLLVASPEYISSKPVPSNPEQLQEWDWIHFSMRPDRTELVGPAGKIASVACRYRLEVDSVSALFEFAVRGLGITAIPEHLARKSIDRGELQRVMPDWSIRPLAFHAVWPDRSRRENLTLLFVRYLAEHQVARVSTA